MRNLFLTILLLATVAPTVNSQTRQERTTQAIALFNQGDYNNARLSLAAIVNEPERDQKVNYYLGASEAMSGIDVDDAIRRLRLAQARNFMKSEANLYLGRAYQLSCDYEQARVVLAKFLATPTSTDKQKLAELYDAQCAAATQLASKIFNVKVVAKSTMPKADMLNAYCISPEVGKLRHNKDFFQSDIDPEGLMYTTERGDAAYFALPDDDGHNKLMKMEKLIGGWGDMSILQGITSDTDADDITPLLMTDGQTLYFASNRPGGMGGYDIYRATYDHESRTFSNPVNMGVPFNSPYDDFLFVPDEFTSRAFFASNRDTRQADTLTVYQIIWDDSVIRSMAQTIDDIRTALSLPLDQSAGTAITSPTVTTHPKSSPRHADKPKDAFSLTICDTLTYTQWEHFRNPQAAQTYRQALSATAEKDSTIRLMAAQRKEFMSLTSSLERNAKLQDLLQTERSIYALDDEIALKTEDARNAELRTIADLISSGQYTPLCSIKITPRKEPQTANPDTPDTLNPSDFSSFSPVFFTEAYDAEDDELMDILLPDERQSILLQDSLLAWSKILTLEADSANPNQAPSLIARSNTLALSAYDTKISTYDAAYHRLLPTIVGYDTTELSDLYTHANAQRIAIAAQTPTNDPIATRRRATNAYERCLQRYASHASGSFPLPATNATSTTTSTPEPEPVCETPVEPPAPQPTPTPQPQVVNYRIQLGVFRNKPNALSKLPDPNAVTSLYLEERNLTRYYYGAYATQADAKADLNAIHAAGFDGAFVVKAK